MSLEFMHFKKASFYLFLDMIFFSLQEVVQMFKKVVVGRREVWRVGWVTQSLISKLP